MPAVPLCGFCTMHGQPDLLGFTSIYSFQEASRKENLTVLLALFLPKASQDFLLSLLSVCRLSSSPWARMCQLQQATRAGPSC